MNRWPALLVAAVLGRVARGRSVVEIELVLPSDAEVLDISPAADGSGVIVTYDDGR